MNDSMKHTTDNQDKKERAYIMQLPYNCLSIYRCTPTLLKMPINMTLKESNPSNAGNFGFRNKQFPS